MNQLIKTKEDELEQIQREIDISTKKFIESSEPRLLAIKDAINEKYQEYYSECINYIRNVSVVSGAAAPFSLLLLQQSSLVIYKELLVMGFVVLLLNILYLQYIAYTDLRAKDKHIVHATLNQYLADGELRKMNDKDSAKSVTAMYDYIKYADKAVGFLQINKNYFEMQTILENSSLRNKLKISLYSLAGGIVLIVSSVVTPYLIPHIETLIGCLMSFI